MLLDYKKRAERDYLLAHFVDIQAVKCFSNCYAKFVCNQLNLVILLT